MEIHSVQEYIDNIEKLKEKYTYVIPSNCSLFQDQVYQPNFLFRGHSDHKNYKLVPGIFRWKKIDSGTYQSEFSQLEHNILYDFISESCRFVKDNTLTNDIAAWLEIAQHFGVPTRLLDLTRNPLVALYFACVSSSKSEASVWVINETAYNRVFFNEWAPVPPVRSSFNISKILDDEIISQNYHQHNDIHQYIQYPWIYKPYYREERMNTQESMFMLWSANRAELTHMMQPNHYMSLEKAVENQETGILYPIIIPADAKVNLLKQLDLCGVNEKYIYPGIDGIGRYIRNKYSSSFDVKK